MNGLSMKAKSKQDRRDFDNGGYDYQQQTIHNQDNYNGGDYYQEETILISFLLSASLKQLHLCHRNESESVPS